MNRARSCTSSLSAGTSRRPLHRHHRSDRAGGGSATSARPILERASALWGGMKSAPVRAGSSTDRGLRDHPHGSPSLTPASSSGHLHKGSAKAARAANRAARAAGSRLFSPCEARVRWAQAAATLMRGARGRCEYRDSRSRNRENAEGGPSMLPARKRPGPAAERLGR